MRKYKSETLIKGILKTFFFFSFMIIFYGFIQGLPKEKEGSVNLSKILKKTAEYCKRLDKVSLHFICNEEIKERIYYRFYSRSFFRENSSVYDYQLVQKNNIIKEQRVLIEENGEPKHEENAELKTKRFWHKHVIFGPVGLFGESQQQNHDYAVKKEEKFEGEKCFVIEVVPKFPSKVRHLFGKAWVRQCDCSIMKVEWNQESMGNIDIIEKEAEKVGAKPRITFISEYAYEKNGIRFPSRYYINEVYYGKFPKVKRKKKLIKSETTVSYSDYKFPTNKLINPNPR
jgi:hypothetical protein